MMEPNFTSDRSSDIRIKQRDGVAIVELKGHIDEIAADVLSSKLDEVFETGQTRIVFDMGEVYYMGSSGLGQIMRAYRQTKGGEDSFVRVANPQPLIRDLFRLTKLDKVLKISSTVEEALSNNG